MTRVCGAAAIAVAERDEPSITAISPKNSPLPSVTITILLAPLTLAMSTLPSSTTNSSRPVEPSSKITSSTSNSLMHFSMAMDPPAFWLARDAMLVGKSGGANDASGPSAALPQGSKDRMPGVAAARLRQNRAEWVPKISVSGPPGNDFASNESYQMVNLYWR